MNVDDILRTLNAHQVACLLIGGMNLTSPHGAIDVFRSVKGLTSWTDCHARAQRSATPSGVPYVGLSDEDMLKCQMALPEAERDQRRIEILKKALGQARHDQHS